MQTTISTSPSVSPGSTTNPAQDLVKNQANLATLNQLVAKYNQLYKTYLQQVEAEASKNDKRRYPYNIKNPNEVKNTLTPDKPFPSNGTEAACFQSCVDTKDCVYALYSNSGCGIDCNPNKCLLYGANAEDIVPVKELPNALPTCPVDAAGTDAWCKSFNHPAINAIIPVLVLRTAVLRGDDGKITGRTDWRTLAMQMPKPSANAADVPFSVDMTTNLQTWSPDSQFSDATSAPDNEISFQFRFFAEYWLNAYNLMSGNTEVIAGQGAIGTFAFAKLTKVGTSDPVNADGSVSYVGTFGGQTMFWNSENPSTGGTAAGLKTAAALASTSESAKFNYNYSAFRNLVWKVDASLNAMSSQVPPQLAGMSIPSWQFLGVQDSAQACQRAASDDPAHVYTMATYFNASYNNPRNGNSVFAGSCYGHVAGAPSSTVSSVREDGVQTMTPPHGYTKLGGKNGIQILRKLYHLNQQIVALTNELKLSAPPSPQPNPTKEGFTQKGDSNDSLSELTKKLETDATKLNEEIQLQMKLDGDDENSKRVLLYSRIKFGVAVVLGLFLAYLAYRFLTAEELPETIQNEIMPESGYGDSYLDNNSVDLE
jgi:hypothetical protein